MTRLRAHIFRARSGWCAIRRLQRLDQRRNSRRRWRRQAPRSRRRSVAGDLCFVPAIIDFPLMNFLVRTQSDLSSLTVPVQRALQSTDARAVVFNVRPFEDFVADSALPRRFNLWLLGAFAGLAVALAVAGIYGTMSYAVAQRTREVGIRVALGAEGRDVLKLVLGEGMKVVLIGIGIGLLGAFALTRWIKSLLFGVSANDPMTFVVITLLLMMIALLACWLPARRATKVDPLVALRYE